ncbi:MAG: VF530 family DNA-binding protein [Gammaproteobacteria bacterium]|nr:VF530 family DNA-binding protein [Gammaproteobacteria bacterium]MBL6999099.1 VF530 family DNA-binding protein [Gammaproteobacteria bacterium]
MNDKINYQNNPLHGVSLKNLLTEMVDHYGFNILFAYLNINCFKTNPSIDSSVKFLKKTDWAREKVESFYLYEFKHLPRASAEQFELPPRDRIVPEGQSPGEPAVLSLEDAERLWEKRDRKQAERGQKTPHRASPRKRPTAAPWAGETSSHREKASTRKQQPEASDDSESSAESGSDPWSKWRK